jgi:hypothetical protein
MPPLLRLMPLRPRLMPLPLLRLPTLLLLLRLRPTLLPLLRLRLRRRSSNRKIIVSSHRAQMTARAERNNVCPGFVFLGEA